MGPDYISELRRIVQVKCKRAVTPKDIEYELSEVEGKPFAVVFLHPVDSVAFVGEPAENEAEARQKAAKQALQDRQEWAPGVPWRDPAEAPQKPKTPAPKAPARPQAPPAGPPKASPPKAGGPGTVILKRPDLALKQRLMPMSNKVAQVKPPTAATIAKVGGVALVRPGHVQQQADGKGWRQKLLGMLSEHFGRVVKEEELDYKVDAVEDGHQYQATLTLPLAGGVAFRGEPRTKHKVAKMSAAEQAVHFADTWRKAAGPAGRAGWGSGGVVAKGAAAKGAAGKATAGKGTAAKGTATATPAQQKGTTGKGATGKGPASAAPAQQKGSPGQAQSDANQSAKTHLITLVQRALMRGWKPKDAVYETERVGDGSMYQSTVFLLAVGEEVAFVGEPAANIKLAEQAAAQQAVLHQNTWLPDGANSKVSAPAQPQQPARFDPAKGKGKANAVKPPAAGAPAPWQQKQQQPVQQIVNPQPPVKPQQAKQPQQQKGAGKALPAPPSMPPPGKGPAKGGGAIKAAGVIATTPLVPPAAGFNFKIELSAFLSKSLRRNLTKDDTFYECERVGDGGRLFQVTLHISAIEGLAFVGEARANQHMAEMASAEQALLSSAQWAPEGPWKDPRKPPHQQVPQRGPGGAPAAARGSGSPAAAHGPGGWPAGKGVAAQVGTGVTLKRPTPPGTGVPLKRPSHALPTPPAAKWQRVDQAGGFGNAGKGGGASKGGCGGVAKGGGFAATGSAAFGKGMKGGKAGKGGKSFSR